MNRRPCRILFQFLTQEGKDIKRISTTTFYFNRLLIGDWKKSQKNETKNLSYIPLISSCVCSCVRACYDRITDNVINK